LDPQLIYHGTTTQCHPDVEFPPGYVISHSKNHWSTELTVIEIIEKCFVPFFERTRLRLGLTPEQWALLIWDVFKAHMTKIVRDLLKARRIKVAYVPATYTSVFSPPDQFIQKEIKAGNSQQFCTWYAEEINNQIDAGIPEDEVWVDFTLTNMKPIHARWTSNTFEKLRDRKELMKKAWEVTGLWSVIHGTFRPTPNFQIVYEDPNEDNDEPQYDSESEYTSASEGDEVEGANSDSDTQSEDAGSDIIAEMQEEEAEEQAVVNKKRRHRQMVLDSSDEEQK